MEIRARLIRLAAVLLLALLAPAAAGCAPEEPIEDAAVRDASEAPAVEEAPAADEDTAAPAEEMAAEDDMADEEAARVRVLGIWGGEELERFEALVAPWTEESGAEMDFTGTRSITADLTIQTEGGDPPDIAIPAEIGLFQEFARDGRLVPLSACGGLDATVREQYPEAFVDLGTVDGELYGFFMKADTKATVWYDPAFFEENDYQPLGADDSFDDLVALSEEMAADDTPPWSAGFESAESTGWPGSDWIQQILLNEAGPEVYDGVIDGSVPYTAPEVRDAWEKMGQIVLNEDLVLQGTTGILATNFVDATYPPFEDPPEAALVYLGGFASGFITEQFPDAVAGEDYDFFTFPGGAVTGGANIVYAFNDDEATCSLMRWLASAEAQQIWVEAGGFTSVNTGVALEDYPTEVARAQAEQLLEAEAFRFDLDDAIGGAFQQALFQGVTEYLSNPDDLDRILENIESARGTE